MAKCYSVMNADGKSECVYEWVICHHRAEAVRGEVGKECASIAQTALDLNDVGEKVIKAIFCK